MKKFSSLLASAALLCTLSITVSPVQAADSASQATSATASQDSEQGLKALLATAKAYQDWVVEEGVWKSQTLMPQEITTAMMAPLMEDLAKAESKTLQGFKLTLEGQLEENGGRLSADQALKAHIRALALMPGALTKDDELFFTSHMPNTWGGRYSYTPSKELLVGKMMEMLTFPIPTRNSIDLLSGKDNVFLLSFLQHQFSPLFLPVRREVIFDIPTLTECFLRNIFPISCPPFLDGKSVHGFQMSPLGHVFHDIGHSLVGIQDPTQTILNFIHDKISSEEDVFGYKNNIRRVLDAATIRAHIFKKAILQVQQATKENNAIQGALFLLAHEEGGLWPFLPLMQPPLSDILCQQLNSPAIVRESDRDDFDTSPFTGTPQNTSNEAVSRHIAPRHFIDGVEQGTKDEDNAATSATVEVTKDGRFLDIHYKKKNTFYYLPGKTKKLDVINNENYQEIVLFALGADSPYVLPPLRTMKAELEAMPVEDAEARLQARLTTTKIGLKLMLKKANSALKVFFEAEAGQAINTRFQQRMEHIDVNRGNIESLQNEWPHFLSKAWKPKEEPTNEPTASNGADMITEGKKINILPREIGAIGDRRSMQDSTRIPSESEIEKMIAEDFPQLAQPNGKTGQPQGTQANIWAPLPPLLESEDEESFSVDEGSNEEA